MQELKELTYNPIKKLQSYYNHVAVLSTPGCIQVVAWLQQPCTNHGIATELVALYDPTATLRTGCYHASTNPVFTPLTTTWHTGSCRVIFNYASTI